MFNSKNIKKARLENKKTQKEIANLLGVAESTYAVWESDKEIIPIKRIIIFCEVLNITMDYALCLTDDNKRMANKFNTQKQGERLKEMRKNNNLTQKKLADILNTEQPVINRYENNKFLIATPFLYTICKKYHVSADYLLGRKD